MLRSHFSPLGSLATRFALHEVHSPQGPLLTRFPLHKDRSPRGGGQAKIRTVLCIPKNVSMFESCNE